MKKRNFIIIFCFIIIFFIGISCCNEVLADTDADTDTSTLTQDLIDGMKNSSNGSNPTGDSAIMYLLARVFTLLQFIGTGISIIIVTKLGISYMISSVDQKAEIKKKAVPIVYGSVLIAATVNILKFIQVLVKNSLT